MTAQDEWAGILAPDEQILWQGAPENRIQLEWSSPFMPLFFVFFTGFSIFWMVMASLAGGFFWTFGLLFFAVGSYNLVGIHFWKAYLRQKTHYTLTTQSAFIAQRAFGKRSLKRYPISTQTEVDFEEGKYANIWFAHEESTGENGTTRIPKGFELIAEGRTVYALIRQLQQDNQ